MKKIQIESAIWNFAKGKKTYLVGALAIVYGWYFKDPNAIVIGLGLLGVRAGVASDIAHIMQQKNLTATQEAEQVTKAVVDTTIPTIATTDTTNSVSQ